MLSTSNNFRSRHNSTNRLEVATRDTLFSNCCGAQTAGRIKLPHLICLPRRGALDFVLSCAAAVNHHGFARTLSFYSTGML